MIGGRRGDEILRDVWILSPETGEWREGPAMPEPMELLGAAPGTRSTRSGRAPTRSTTRQRTRTSGPRSLVTRHGLQTFYVDGTLLTVGGCTTQLRDSQVVERRDPPAR